MEIHSPVRHSAISVLVLALGLPGLPGVANNLPSTGNPASTLRVIVAKGTKPRVTTPAPKGKPVSQFIFVPPAGIKGAPSQTVSGGRRNNGKCTPNHGPSSQVATNPTEQLLGLLPPGQTPQTISAQPSILVYLPQITAQKVLFSLEDSQGKGIYRTPLTLSNTPGVVGISLKNAPPLEVGKEYRWLVTIVCPKAGPQNPFVIGTMQRVQPNPNLQKQLEQAKPLDQVALYAQSGLWYEAVATLFDLKRNQPKNPELDRAWQELLQSAGLKDIAQAPLK